MRNFFRRHTSLSPEVHRNQYALEAELPPWAVSGPWWLRREGRRVLRGLYVCILMLVTVRAPDMIAGSWSLLNLAFSATITLPVLPQTIARLAILATGCAGLWISLSILGWMTEIVPVLFGARDMFDQEAEMKRSTLRMMRSGLALIPCFVLFYCATHFR